MIKFFRHVRKSLLTENKISKYMLYAIGEIVLVVIGILIALSINNWNEYRKEIAIEKIYLKGIRDDLQKDIEQAILIIESNLNELNIINKIEPRFNLEPSLKLHKIDTSNVPFQDLFQRENSFRSTKGTYNSLISDGKSNLIKNKILFQKIQSIYDEQQPRVFSIYDDLKTRSNNLTAEYSFERFHWDYKTLMSPGNEKVVAYIANLWDGTQYYCMYLNLLIPEMEKIIQEINIELKNYEID